MAELTLDRISKRYDDGTVAVDELSLDITDGELMIFVGPSGCGKTTALRMIAGLEEISDGELRIDGEVVNDRPPKRRDMAMVFQNYALYPHMTVRQNMSFGLQQAKVPKAQIERKVTEVAETLGLSEYLDRKPANLSGGQRQRVAMGRAIVREPKAFLMDEPLSNLDAKLRTEMRTELARIQGELGTTTVYVTHDQIEAMTLGDRVAVMRKGVLQQVSTPRELYDAPANLFVAGFMGTPAINLISAKVDREKLVLPIGEVPLDDRLRAALDKAERGTPLIVGLRPEHLFDAALVDDANARGVTFQTRVHVLEAMGAEYYAYSALEDPAAADGLTSSADDDREPVGRRRRQLVARLSIDSTVCERESIELWFDPRRLHIFECETGNRLTDSVR
ncbi:MAG: sn-glycerol-3-phosphate ABC transporter ATP-binding protein UgpC [Solirubrobacterales bacterium]|nr:sn-glycerol-3-phosphate ABC transporter ATP-binding protein UgpC [Solirubrobacterales bacterium]MBV8945259.1 sn-glycerol-3-phosphate ABC transporter ATP-binding protein UgpC [Solirubrobacterales bacterium]